MTCHHLSLARVKQKTHSSLSYFFSLLFASPARVTSGDKCQEGTISTRNNDFGETRV